MKNRRRETLTVNERIGIVVIATLITVAVLSISAVGSRWHELSNYFAKGEPMWSGN